MQYLWSQTSATSTNDAVAPEEDASQEEDMDVCAICLYYVKKTNVSITTCGHKFCTSCLLSSLRTNNKCPTCRAEIEPARECIQPISASTATDIIREEERKIDLTRRIEVINSFSGRNGKSTMMYSLCREFAFATAHGIARTQKMKTDKTYDSSWEFFDSSDDENHEE